MQHEERNLHNISKDEAKMVFIANRKNGRNRKTRKCLVLNYLDFHPILLSHYL
jgi:hypothetical protein